MNPEFNIEKYNEVIKKKNETGKFSFTATDHQIVGSTIEDLAMSAEPEKMKYEFMTPEQISAELEKSLGFIEVYIKRGNMDDAVKREANAFLINIKFLDSVDALPGTMQEWLAKLEETLSKKSAA